MSKLSNYRKSVKGKRVLIFGLGLQGGGVGAARFFARNKAKVRVTDLKTRKQLAPSIDKLKKYPIDYVLGKNREKDVLWADIVVVNPDVWNKNADNPLVNLAFDIGKKVETPMALFVELAECPVIGITGTRGKTTTTVMINEILKKAELKTILGGNIPNSATLDSIEQTKKADYAVLELSNYQLHGFHLKKISPHIAVLTNIYPDHWASYSSEKEYIYDKSAIYRYQKKGDYLVLPDNKNYRLPGLSQEPTPGVVLPVDWRFKVPGEHNRENAALALKVGEILKIKKPVIKKALTSFAGVPFRLEKVAVRNGATFINDTTSTTPTAANIALKSFPKGKIILIAGGNSKNLPLEKFAKTTVKRAKHLILLKGTGTKEFKKEIQKKFTPAQGWILGRFDDLKKAVKAAYKKAQKGDVILFSPGFTSFAMWENEFERGKEFNKIISNI